MRMSKSFVPTLKEVPADATVASHQLLVRAGYIRQLAAGIYSILPLGQRSLLKITAIVREEMNAIGAQEFYLPALNPREVWEESGRWTVMGENMFRLKDRKGADLCLAMTHEEIFTVLARAELRSYRQLPQSWYQIQTKFRDEPRPKSGLLRVRQFTMKDSYSFDLNPAGLDVAFEKHRQAYVKIFDRCGLRTIQVEAHSGAMGGTGSTEFMVPTDAGEDLIASCEKCGYAANTEKAQSRVETPPKYASSAALEDFPTPGVVTIEALAQKPYSVPAEQQLKTLVYVADDKPVIAIVRGDDQLNEAKLQTATGAQVLRPAHPEEIVKALGAHPGSLGGVGVKDIRVFIDSRLAGSDLVMVVIAIAAMPRRPTLRTARIIAAQHASIAKGSRSRTSAASRSRISVAVAESAYEYPKPVWSPARKWTLTSVVESHSIVPSDSGEAVGIGKQPTSTVEIFMNSWNGSSLHFLNAAIISLIDCLIVCARSGSCSIDFMNFSA